MDDFKIGDRVKLRHDLDVYPLGRFPAGAKGTVMREVTGEYADDCALVLMDDHFPDLDEWENLLQVGTVDCDESPATVDDFELIGPDAPQADLFDA